MVKIPLPGGVLTRKLLRDFAHRKMAVAVLVALVAVGVAGIFNLLSLYIDLDSTRAEYYREYRLTDFVIDMKRAPENVVRYVEDAPNVRRAQGRIALPVLVDLPHKVEPISGQAISLPQIRRPIINDVVLTSGSWFSGESEKEVILNDAFAKANALKPGDRLRVNLLDEQHELLIIGTGISPEFVFLMPTDGGFAPDNERFGVMYLPEEFLQRTGDLEGAYNQVLGDTYDDSEHAIRQTLDLLEDQLDAWGVANTTPASDLPSVTLLQSELTGLKVNAYVMPTIFLGVAMLVLNVLLARLVAQQRGIVGTLRAIGRSKASITWHYLGFGITVALFGAVGGIALGRYLQLLLIELYREYYTFPRLDAEFHWSLVFASFVVSICAGTIGTIRGALHAASLNPAEAMRPPPPEKGGHVWVERFGFIWNRLSFRWRLVVRAIFRNPFRSSVNLFTAAIAMALMILTFSLADSMNYLVEYQYRMVSHEDLSIALRDPQGQRAPTEVVDLPTIGATEPQLNVVCDISNGLYRKRMAVTGLPKNNRLFTPLNLEGEPIRVPDVGLVLSDKAAEILHVQPGDVVSLRPLIGRREKVMTPVVATVKSYLGVTAYADIDYLSRLLGEDRVANQVLTISESEGHYDAFYREVKERPTVVGTSSRARSMKQLQETFIENMQVSLTILILFAGLIAFGSVLNTSLVSLSEREREVGTFRVLGYTPAEIAGILRGEQVLLTAIGTVVGIPIGLAMRDGISKAYDTDFFRMPVMITPERFFQAAFLMFIFTAAAQVLLYTYVRKLPWLEALKIKE